MKRRLVPTVALAAGLLVLAAGCREEKPVPVYGLIWSDEFDGPAGQLPDADKWAFDTGTDWGNAQLEWDTDRPENVSLDGQGNLAITARIEQYEGQPYTSGRIKTKGLFERRYGRFEARIKIPVGQGIWPAFWMLGNDIDTVHWPTCGEIDIMEVKGQEPRTTYASLHGPGYSGDGAVTSAHTLAQGGLDLAFHEYAIEWSSQEVVWQIDGHTFKVVNAGDLPVGEDWVFDHPFFILLNVAVGGNWVGRPDLTTQFPQTMLVDYVRVYGEK